ncbi:hypothetical protein [Beggiatoa leptomitoformis]|uniref:Uncharacterized protein n=1 Tax=Beggiatoa leptomitoformis TaxID=288004 RepID=A0A2N9YDS9_9GAMM|nr:hypothetical protein [Beggiatoa leptomitoformis]ALG69070.1 hypothetical protein AL038_16990 [Beggiatoa leptomitoformis]AUI68519.1 hypothetical protein BLE401_07245 [Beggiatoa leptomitoformis]
MNFLDSHDPAVWYMNGYNDAKNGKQKFGMFFLPGTKRIKEAYNRGYQDAKNGNIDVQYMYQKTDSERFMEVLKNINSQESLSDRIAEKLTKFIS